MILTSRQNHWNNSDAFAFGCKGKRGPQACVIPLNRFYFPSLHSNGNPTNAVYPARNPTDLRGIAMLDDSRVRGLQEGELAKRLFHSRACLFPKWPEVLGAIQRACLKPAVFKAGFAFSTEMNSLP